MQTLPIVAARLLAALISCGLAATAKGQTLDPAIHGQWGTPFAHDINAGNFPCDPLISDPYIVFNAIHMIMVAKPGLQGRVFVMDQANKVKAPGQARPSSAMR